MQQNDFLAIDHLKQFNIFTPNKLLKSNKKVLLRTICDDQLDCKTTFVDKQLEKNIFFAINKTQIDK